MTGYDPVHWIGDAPTSLHGNGAASFGRTSRDAGEVTCRLCLTLLDRERRRATQASDPGPIVWDPPLSQAESDAYWAAITDDPQPSQP